MVDLRVGFLNGWQTVLFYLVVACILAANLYNFIVSVNSYKYSQANPSISIVNSAVEITPVFSLIFCTMNYTSQFAPVRVDNICWYGNVRNPKPCGYMEPSLRNCTVVKFEPVAITSSPKMDNFTMLPGQESETLTMQSTIPYPGSTGWLGVVYWLGPTLPTLDQLEGLMYNFNYFTVPFQLAAGMQFSLVKTDKSAIGGSSVTNLTADTSFTMKSMQCAAYSRDICTEYIFPDGTWFSSTEEAQVFDFSYTAQGLLVSMAALVSLSMSVMKCIFPKKYRAENAIGMVFADPPPLLQTSNGISLPEEQEEMYLSINHV